MQRSPNANGLLPRAASARRHFKRAIAARETAEALEGLGWAEWWLDDPPASFAARERAYRLYQQRKDARAAARIALALGVDSIDYRGEPAVGRGWLERARRLLEGHTGTPEFGWALLWEGHWARVFESDPRRAQQCGIKAAALGRSLQLSDLEMLGSALQGLALIDRGRFHRIHHSDPRLDASSSLRFHPVEGAAQTIYQAVAILLFGIQLDAMILFDTVLLVMLFVQHANVAWPESLDRALRWVFVTPDVHHVHHSRDQHLTDSNFADLFTVWDRLLGTYREATDRRAIAYGLAEFDDDRYQTIKGMTLMPLAPTAGDGRDWSHADELQHVART